MYVALLKLHFLVTDRKAFRVSEALPEALPRAQNLIRYASRIMTRPKRSRGTICEVETALGASPNWVAMAARISRRKSSLLCASEHGWVSFKSDRDSVSVSTPVSVPSEALPRGVCREHASSPHLFCSWLYRPRENPSVCYCSRINPC